MKVGGRHNFEAKQNVHMQYKNSYDEHNLPVAIYIKCAVATDV